MELNYLIAFALGFVAAAGKDLLQSWIIKRNLAALGKMDRDDEMARMMETVERVTRGFSLNSPRNEEEDSKQQEPYYRSYFS